MKSYIASKYSVFRETNFYMAKPLHWQVQKIIAK